MGDNARSKKGRVVILIRDMLSGPLLHFHQVHINGLSLSNITKGDNTKVRKAELSFLYMTHCLVLVYISAKCHQNIPKVIQVTEQTQNLFQIKQRGDNSKSKKGRVVILVREMSSGLVLHFYQVSSKYSKGYSSYRLEKKFYADTDADANGIHPKNNMSPPFSR